MGTQRQSRPSEKLFEEAWHGMRNLDKLVWYGKHYHLDDLRDEIVSLKYTLDRVVAAFAAETQDQKPAPGSEPAVLTDPVCTSSGNDRAR